MKLSSIARRNKKIFESKINKKSLFLRSLPKKKYEGIKKVEEGKTELIIDKILGLGEFERDYGFFCYNNKSSTPKNIILNQNMKSSLKNRINLIIQKNNLNNYDDYKYEEDNDNNNIYKSRDNIEKKYNNNRFWKSKKIANNSNNSLPYNNSNNYLNQKQNSFLSKVGNNIITSKTNDKK